MRNGRNGRVTSEAKFKQHYPLARIERGYAGMENRVFCGSKPMSDRFSRPNRAWADAWRKYEAQRRKRRARRRELDR
jgi:hypothetical protein